MDSGEFWDHHYANFPLGYYEDFLKKLKGVTKLEERAKILEKILEKIDLEENDLKDLEGATNPEERAKIIEKIALEKIDREKLTTLWYHDHRLDFTASNVYAGLSGFYLLFDEQDSGNENDTNPKAWRLPSGDYDVPLILHDVLFDEKGGVVFSGFQTDGWLGDHVTVNRTIRPRFKVKRRKYRFRLLNGGPSRFYQLFLKKLKKGSNQPEEDLNFTIITGDGNFLPQPVTAESIVLSVAQRVDIIIDFSDYKDGDQIVLLNLMEQINGKGPSGRTLDPDPDDDPKKNYAKTGVIRFDVVGGEVKDDPSQIPDEFRPLPTIDMSEVKRERLWVFDYDGGLWTINNQVMDPNRIDAGIDQGSAEIWTFRNAGNEWSHPIHSHFTEFLILEVNGKPFRPSFIESVSEGDPAFIEYLGLAKGGAWKTMKPIKRYFGGPRRDVATLLPNDEIRVFMRWKDFLGKHVMHCHNVVHEDHAMMVRWDIMEPGKGFDGSKEAKEVYTSSPPYPDPRPLAPKHLEERPASAAIGEG
ncbi:multicopper oxidase domain-containing protein [Candidatus Poribacteria bacterium]|nr:multicopper oxidase domain-containing protein [Candidatus Poribacteria bacterium]